MFFWVAIGWKFISLTNPDMTVINNPLQPFNMFLKFFLSAFIFLCIALVQYILYLIGNTMNTPKVQAFTDICSVSNISILIMIEKIHGYYIHGKAPW